MILTVLPQLCSEAHLSIRN